MKTTFLVTLVALAASVTAITLTQPLAPRWTDCRVVEVRDNFTNLDVDQLYGEGQRAEVAAFYATLSDLEVCGLVQPYYLTEKERADLYLKWADFRLSAAEKTLRLEN